MNTLGDALAAGTVKKTWGVAVCPSCGRRYSVDVYHDLKGRVVLIDGPLECLYHRLPRLQLRDWYGMRTYMP